jgi:hypothetical protein
LIAGLTWPLKTNLPEAYHVVGCFLSLYVVIKSHYLVFCKPLKTQYRRINTFTTLLFKLTCPLRSRASLIQLFPF